MKFRPSLTRGTRRNRIAVVGGAATLTAMLRSVQLHTHCAAPVIVSPRPPWRGLPFQWSCTTPLVRSLPLRPVRCSCLNSIWETATPFMSIYLGHRQRASDVQVEHVSRRRIEIPAAQPVHLRKAQPVLAILPKTAVWIASLPTPVRPLALASQFARVANHVCAVWHDASACEEYLAGLVIDSRGGREGFPNAALQNIETLQAYHAYLNPASGFDVPWRGPCRSLWDGREDA